jgi:tetratricopeptide (TPR) repeat protein
MKQFCLFPKVRLFLSGLVIFCLSMASGLRAQNAENRTLPPYFSYALDPVVEHPRYAGSAAQYTEDLSALRSWVEAEGLGVAIDFDALKLEGDSPTRAEADAINAARLKVFGNALWEASRIDDRRAREKRLAETAEAFADLIGQPVPPAVATPLNEALLEVGKASVADTLGPEQIVEGITALRRAGSNPVAWLLLANVAFEMEDWPESNTYCLTLSDVALALDPGLIEAHVARWAAASVTEDFALASRDGYWVLENASQLAPAQWEQVFRLHGQVMLGWLEQLTTVPEPDDDLIDNVIRDYLAWYSPERQSAFFAERLNQTRDRVGRARYLLWQDGVRPTDALAVRQKLAELVGAEEVENALEIANRFVRANDRNAFALVVRGELFSALGRSDRALEDLEGALSLDPRNIDAAIMRGSIHLERGNLEQAENALNEAIALSPYNSVLRYMRANFRTQTEQLAGALIDLDMAVAYAAPEEMATVRFQRARVRAAAGDHEGAAQDFVAAIEAPETDPEVALEVGKMLAEWGMKLDARRCFRAAAAAGHPEAAAQLDALETSDSD